MKITISVSDLTQAQFDWLLHNTALQWQISESATRVCVTFEVGLSGNNGAVMHREMPVRAWLGIVEHLKTMTRTAEALLTPDVLPE